MVTSAWRCYALCVLLAYAAFARSSTHTPRNWVKLQAFCGFVGLVSVWTRELERHHDRNEKAKFVHLCRAGESSLSGLLAIIQSASHELDGQNDYRPMMTDLRKKMLDIQARNPGLLIA